MPQPPAYSRTKDFTENFGTETDHSAVNAELDNASNSINDIRSRLAILQADDGKLRPQVVTPDSVSPALFEKIVNQVELDAVTLVADATAAASATLARAAEALDAASTAGISRDEAVAASQVAVAAAAGVGQASSVRHEGVTLDLILSGQDPLKVTELMTSDLQRLSGQLAQNAEAICVDGNTIYALCKGSYTSADRSFMQVYKVHDGVLQPITGIPIDLGVGADARAMVCLRGALYIFTGSQIRVFSTRSFQPALIATIARPNAGFVQTAMIYGEYIVAPVWGDARIEVWSIQNDQPVLQDNFVTPSNMNASVVDGNDGYLYCINHSDSANQLARLQISPLGKVASYTAFTIPEMVNCRYADVHDGRLYTGSFSTGSTVEVAINQATPAAVRTFQNLSSLAVVRGRFLVGGFNGKTYAVEIATGQVMEMYSDKHAFYPLVVGDCLVCFYSGNEAKPVGASGNDAAMGQKLAILATERAAKWTPRAAPTARPLIRNAGSFTPYISGTLSAGSGSYTRSGLFSVVGDLCFFSIQLLWTTHSGTGNISVHGLPFQSIAHPAGFACAVIAGGLVYDAGASITGAVQPSTQMVQILQQRPGAGLDLVPMSSTGEMYICGVYPIAESNL